MITYLSVFKEANWKADANAFAALMGHIREVDGDAHTVLMMQVENEVGCPGATRDQVPEAKAAFDASVPRQLMDYIVKNRDKLVPEFRQYGGGRKQDFRNMGRSVRRAGHDQRDIYGLVLRIVRRQSGAGRKGRVPDTHVYQRGPGRVHRPILQWRSAAHQVECLAAGRAVNRHHWARYLSVRFAEWCARYDRSGNPLWIPETRSDAANAFYAIGNHAAMGISPFGIDPQADSTTPWHRLTNCSARPPPRF